MQKTSIPKQGVMSDNMFHYADVPLSVIDNLINFEEELQVLNRVQKFKKEKFENYLGYRKISDSGWQWMK